MENLERGNGSQIIKEMITMKINVCFGCLDVENIVKCPKHDCTHYEARDTSLDLDHEKNREINIMVAENSKMNGRSASARLGNKF